MRPHLAPPPPAGLRPAHPPSFSVIVAAHQAASTVGEAVASALAQTCPPLEVIVCDDGSTDDIEGALAPHRERITLLRQPRGGAGSARNAAARAAGGDFVAILDADDVDLPERLEALAELGAARPDLDILLTDAYLEREGRRFARYYERERFESADQRRAIIGRDFIPGCVAVRRARLLELGGFDESLPRAEDSDLWLRMVLSGSRAGLVDEPLVRYRLRVGSLSSDRILNLRASIEMLARAREAFELSADEDALATRSLRLMRSDLRLSEAERALQRGERDRRARSLTIARSGEFGPRTRAKALLAAAAPDLARRRLLERGSASRRPRLEEAPPPA